MQNALNLAQHPLSEGNTELIQNLLNVESGKPIILEQDGKALAALISIEDLQLFERLIEEEDRIDIAEANQALAEIQEQGTVSWESIQAELGI